MQGSDHGFGVGHLCLGVQFFLCKFITLFENLIVACHMIEGVGVDVAGIAQTFDSRGVHQFFIHVLFDDFLFESVFGHVGYHHHLVGKVNLTGVHFLHAKDLFKS